MCRPAPATWRAAYEALEPRAGRGRRGGAGAGAVGAHAAGRDGDPAAAAGPGASAFQGGAAAGHHRPVPAGGLCRFPAAAATAGRSDDAAGRLGALRHPAAAAGAGRARRRKDARAGGWAAQLRDRFAAAAQRGDRLHEQEAARFELDIEGQPAKALDLASRNYQAQKEARDAEILMRAALAAEPAQGGPAGAGLAARQSLRGPGAGQPGGAAGGQGGDAMKRWLIGLVALLVSAGGPGPQAQRQLPDAARHRGQHRHRGALGHRAARPGLRAGTGPRRQRRADLGRSAPARRRHHALRDQPSRAHGRRQGLHLGAHRRR